MSSPHKDFFKTLGTYNSVKIDVFRYIVKLHYLPSSREINDLVSLSVTKT